MSSFPTLKTGAVTQYPAVREARHSTVVLRFVDGAVQRYRDSGEATHRWVIRLSQLDEDELGAIERLFEEVNGRAGSFSFRDPWSGTLYETCSFEGDELGGLRRDEGRGETVLVIRENRS